MKKKLSPNTVGEMLILIGDIFNLIGRSIVDHESDTDSEQSESN